MWLSALGYCRNLTAKDRYSYLIILSINSEI